MLPATLYTACLRLLFVVNLIFSYVVISLPINQILEQNLSTLFKNKDSTELNFYIVLLSRTLVCVTSCVLAISFEHDMDIFLSILGALLCAPVALMTPALLHLKNNAAT